MSRNCDSIDLCSPFRMMARRECRKFEFLNGGGYKDEDEDEDKDNDSSDDNDHDKENDMIVILNAYTVHMSRTMTDTHHTTLVLRPFLSSTDQLRTN